ncbi:protein FAM241B-like [Lytechinus variegatus]|uniref:protein FAM241B-like n=1 Tax=Lytechinus variegatus TaxID=7654 RepID=UPI001BB252E0|nr:protein FAM241B-like [Lytechinus variegatus]
MVRVLASGDVVADDDPRAQASRNQQSGSSRQMGRIRHDNDMGNQGGYGGGAYGGGGGAQGGGAGGVSIFQVLNQKLLDAGIPRWTLGTTVVEPIVTVGFILAMLLLGVKGLFLGAILFAAVKFSGGMDESGAGNSNTGRNTGGGGRGGGTGGGRTTGGRVLGGR